MEKTQKLMVVLPKDLIQRGRLLAAKNQISLSELLSQALTALIEDQGNDEIARQRMVGMIRQGLNLGTNGSQEWAREDLHVRKL